MKSESAAHILFGEHFRHVTTSSLADTYPESNNRSVLNDTNFLPLVTAIEQKAIPIVSDVIQFVEGASIPPEVSIGVLKFKDALAIRFIDDEKYTDTGTFNRDQKNFGLWLINRQVPTGKHYRVMQEPGIPAFVDRHQNKRNKHLLETLPGLILSHTLDSLEAQDAFQKSIQLASLLVTERNTAVARAFRQWTTEHKHDVIVGHFGAGHIQIVDAPNSIVPYSPDGNPVYMIPSILIGQVYARDEKSNILEYLRAYREALEAESDISKPPNEALGDYYHTTSNPLVRHIIDTEKICYPVRNQKP